MPNKKKAPKLKTSQTKQKHTYRTSPTKYATSAANAGKASVKRGPYDMGVRQSSRRRQTMKNVPTSNAAQTRARTGATMNRVAANKKARKKKSNY